MAGLRPSYVENHFCKLLYKSSSTYFLWITSPLKHFKVTKNVLNFPKKFYEFPLSHKSKGISGWIFYGFHKKKKTFKKYEKVTWSSEESNFDSFASFSALIWWISRWSFRISSSRYFSISTVSSRSFLAFSSKTVFSDSSLLISFTCQDQDVWISTYYVQILNLLIGVRGKKVWEPMIYHHSRVSIPHLTKHKVYTLLGVRLWNVPCRQFHHH